MAKTPRQYPPMPDPQPPAPRWLTFFMWAAWVALFVLLTVTIHRVLWHA